MLNDPASIAHDEVSVLVGEITDGFKELESTFFYRNVLKGFVGGCLYSEGTKWLGFNCERLEGDSIELRIARVDSFHLVTRHAEIMVLDMNNGMSILGGKDESFFFGSPLSDDFDPELLHKLFLSRQFGDFRIRFIPHTTSLIGTITRSGENSLSIIGSKSKKEDNEFLQIDVPDTSSKGLYHWEMRSHDHGDVEKLEAAINILYGIKGFYTAKTQRRTVTEEIIQAR